MAKKDKKEKRVLSPISVFAILIIVTILLSALFSGLGKIQVNHKYPFSWLSQGSYSAVNSVSGQLETQVVEVESLLNTKGIQYIVSNFVTNFVSFAPLGMILIALIGLSVAEKSGLFEGLSLLKKKDDRPKYILTLGLIFFGVISSIFTDLGYVVLIPLGAMLFTLQNRNPLGGIIAAFAGVAGGYGVSVFISSFDTSLGVYTTAAAKLLDNKYTTAPFGNIFFMLVATILITIIGTIITEKYVIPKLPKRKEEVDEIKILERKHKRGILFASIAVFICVVLFAYMIIPAKLPGAGILLDKSASGYVNQLLGANSYLQQGLVVLVTGLFFIAGIFYGFGSKSIKNDNDVVNFITSSKNSIGYLIILLFFASQFIAIFKKTNIGVVLNISLMNLIQNLNITGLPLIILFFVIAMIGSLFITVPSTKWSIMAPVIVPMFMQSNLSPEFAQMVFRGAISPINMVTPLLAYYVIYLGYLQIYNKTDEVITIRKSFKYLLPYTLFFALTFLILIVIWYIIGLPIGPGIYPTL